MLSPQAPTTRDKPEMLCQLTSRHDNLLLTDVVEEAVAEAQALVDVAPRKKAERKPLPAHLPREERVLHPAVEACPDCNGELKLLGEEASEQLDMRR